jgi:hypothetical protein
MTGHITLLLEKKSGRKKLSLQKHFLTCDPSPARYTLNIGL